MYSEEVPYTLPTAQARQNEILFFLLKNVLALFYSLKSLDQSEARKNYTKTQQQKQYCTHHHIYQELYI